MRTSSLETGKPLTINIRGNYRQSSAGTLSLGIGGTQGEQYDHLQVQGSANLNGTLAVFSLNGFRPVGGNAFEAIHTGGALVGQFAQVNDSLNNNPSLQRIDVYAPNGVALVYVQAAPTPTPPIVGPTPPPPQVLPLLQNHLLISKTQSLCHQLIRRHLYSCQMFLGFSILRPNS